jgi:hypothetical protein
MGCPGAAVMAGDASLDIYADDTLDTLSCHL